MYLVNGTKAVQNAQIVHARPKRGISEKHPHSTKCFRDNSSLCPVPHPAVQHLKQGLPAVLREIQLNAKIFTNKKCQIHLNNTKKM